MRDSRLIKFIAESNMIEGITRPPINGEVRAHRSLMERGHILLEDLETFVHRVQPDAVLRDSGQCVSVGSHVPPAGGPGIVYALQELLHAANSTEDDLTNAWHTHCAYEKLHPFTDGNGRSGRALWLWMTLRDTPWDVGRGFLHSFYYQTLENS